MSNDQDGVWLLIISVKRFWTRFNQQRLMKYMLDTTLFSILLCFRIVISIMYNWPYSLHAYNAKLAMKRPLIFSMLLVIFTLQSLWIKAPFCCWRCNKNTLNISLIKKKSYRGSIQELYIIIRLRAFEHTNSSKELPIFGHWGLWKWFSWNGSAAFHHTCHCVKALNSLYHIGIDLLEPTFQCLIIPNTCGHCIKDWH